MKNRFSYVDEDDKCYGLTGMVISLNVLDNDTMLHKITLDNGEGGSISFTPDFFFSSNPRYSAKIAWNEMIKQYQMLTGLVLGNILCRYNVYKRQSVTRDMLEEIQHMIEDEGHDNCSLEDDEIDMIFQKTLNYMSDIYTNYKVQNIVHKFVDIIKERRTMSGDEVRDELEYLRRL